MTAKKIYLLVNSEYDETHPLAVFSKKETAEGAAKLINHNYKIEYGDKRESDDGLDGDTEFACVQEILLDPTEPLGYWRYWIIKDRADDFGFFVGVEQRWSSYTMERNGIPCGACGLGWTKEDAKLNAQEHFKKLGL